MAKASDHILHEREKLKTIREQIKQQDRMHEQKMIELKFRRESEEISHENSMSRMRIKMAELRKIQERKEWLFNQQQKRYKGGG